MSEEFSKKYVIFVSLGVSFVLFCLAFSLAANRGLWSSLETQSAQIAREFFRGGDLIVPHLNGIEDNEKPAFYFWIITALSLFYGAVNEFTARLPSLLSVLFILLLYRVMKKEKTSASLTLLAFTLYITSPKIFWASQVARMDMLFSLLCFSQIIAFLRFIHEDKANKKSFFYYAYFLCAGLAVLCKGPAGIIVPAIPVTLFFLWNKKFRQMFRFFFGKGLLVFLAIVLPWYILVSVKTEGRFFTKFLLSDNLGRFLGPGKLAISQEFSRRQPVWFYIPHFFSGFFPWSLVFFFYLIHFVRNRKQRPSAPEEGILLTYILCTIVFFSLAGIKRADYLLPVFPAAAYLAARYLLQNASKNILKAVYIPAGILFMALTGTLLFLSGWGNDIQNSFLSGYFPAPDLTRAVLVLSHIRQEFLITLFVFLITAILFIAGIIKNQKTLYLTLLLVIISTIFVYSTTILLPFVNRHRDIRLFCRAIENKLSEGELWFYGFWNDEFVFYLDRFIEPRSADKGMGIDELKAIMKQENRKVSFLIRKKDFLHLQEEGIDIPYVFEDNVAVLYPVYLISNVNPDKP